MARLTALIRKWTDRTGISLPLKHFPRRPFLDFGILINSRYYSIDFEIPVNYMVWNVFSI